ncbi:hypothetical protein [Aureimonas sp. D3]|uniref:hypothetical protein n=1 Tax=Aureimonas sp. D3 TaxID=1638164 RepID=UPI0007819C93|nr:hypothetical protein [Aureimonas sp. D3]
MTFKLYLSTARDNRPFQDAMTYAYLLSDPSGEPVRAGETPEGEPLPKTAGDPAYVALLDCLPHVPQGSSLHIVSNLDHLTGKEEGPYPYPGVFNETPEARREARYRKRDKKTWANLTQLQAIDLLLTERRISTSCRRPTLEEDVTHRTVSKRAADLRDFDPTAPNPEDY